MKSKLVLFNISVALSLFWTLVVYWVARDWFHASQKILDILGPSVAMIMMIMCWFLFGMCNAAGTADEQAGRK